MAAAAGARRAREIATAAAAAGASRWAPQVPRREIATAAAGASRWAMSTLPETRPQVPRREIATAAAAARWAMSTQTRPQVPRRGTNTLANNGSTTVLQLSEDLVKEIKAETSRDKILGMAEDLLKALKDTKNQAPLVIPSCKSDVTMEAIKIGQLESSISEIKANANLNSTIMFTMFGIFGCLMMAIPIGVYEIHAEAKANEKKSQKRHEKCQMKYQKLKSAIRAMEEDKRVAEEHEAEEVEDEAGSGSWITWICNLLGRSSSTPPHQ